MPNNLDLIGDQTPRKRDQTILRDLMVATMQEVVSRRKTPHNFPSTKREIIETFIAKGREIGLEAKLPTATRLFTECSASITNFLDLGLMMEQVVKDNFDTQEQLQEIKDLIMHQFQNEEKVTITKDAAMAMISALKAKSDAQKIIADSIFKQVAANIDIDRNDILEKKMDSGVGRLNINMNLSGTLEEKTQQALEIASRHADLLKNSMEGSIEANFKVKEIDTEEE